MIYILIAMLVAILIIIFFVKPDEKVDDVYNVYNKITPDEARQMMEEEIGYQILDVRTNDEYKQMHIENAISVPLNQIDRLIETIVPDKNTVLLVYCRSGVRSEEAAKKLIKMGYINVYDFGGITQWNQES